MAVAPAAAELVDGRSAEQPSRQALRHDAARCLDPVGRSHSGFDERKLPEIWEAMRDPGPRVTAIADPTDIDVWEAYPAWAGHVESMKR